MFYAGSLDALKRAVAVVGTRSPSEAGREAARRVAALLAARGCAVVTGMARGVDAEAALAAVRAGGVAVGVLPHLLAPEVAGWLSTGRFTAVSLHLFEDRRALRQRLAERSRLIAELAHAVVVPEARRRRRWGTIHCVRRALELGKPVAVLRPLTRDEDVRSAFEAFVAMGATPVSTPEEAVDVACRPDKKTAPTRTPPRFF